MVTRTPIQIVADGLAEQLCEKYRELSWFGFCIGHDGVWNAYIEAQWASDPAMFREIADALDKLKAQTPT